MKQIKLVAIISSCIAVMTTHNLFAAILKTESANPTVVLIAGQTIEIPVSSTAPIAADLTATGAFQQGDVIFAAGPGCHLSANGCTLLITAASTSKSYKAVSVVVSESAAINKSVFTLSVIQPGESTPTAILPKISFTPRRMTKVSPPISPPLPTQTNNDRPTVLQRSGNASFYGIAESHPSSLTLKKGEVNDFIPATNGPAYEIVRLTNHGMKRTVTVTITGSGAPGFSLDKKTTDYGANQNCVSMPHLASEDSCLVIVKGKIGDPRQPPQTATLTIRSDRNNAATFNLTSTTYIYVAGGFNTLGNASVSGGDLLAECTAGTCSNALQGTTGNNYASTNFSVGQWINALSVTPAGNLMVGGAFGAIGGATSGASSGTAALLAQCTPGPMTGNACFNQMNGASSNYAFNNAYIDAITAPFAINSSNFMAVGGDFTNIRGFSVTSGGRMLAKCLYNTTSPSATCNNYTGSSLKFANNAITALNTLGSSSSSPLVNTGGLFTQIADYPTSAPSSGTTFASCSNTGVCSQSMSSNPNNSILGMTDDGTNLYMGGTFTQAGGYTDNSGGYPLVSCVPGSTTTCSNALANTNDANGYIEGLAYSGGNLFVGGKFTTIGGATPVSGGNMLAVCTPGGSCSNFVSDINPYASGTDWGGGISAIAVGTQVLIVAS